MSEQIMENIENNESNESEQSNQTNLEKTTEILLKLGDIIQIIDPTNEILNNNIFLIEYIDSSKIKLINAETFEKTILQISPDGIIGDGNIRSIKIISSNPKQGYARQNDLLPGTWINIYFGGDIPTIITGKITNLEEDMIEVKTTDDDTIYINFDYKGIPEDLPIDTFEIRPAISEKQEQVQHVEELEEGEEIEEIPKKVAQEKIQRIFFDMADIEFGDIIKVEEFVNIDKDKYRYNIETQTNDLLEEMISTIPNYKRTHSVLNSIHTMITRFIQLREMSSIFDTNRNITGIIKHTAEDIPLANYLSQFKNNLYWILMVAKNIKKIYPDPTNTNESTEYKRFDDYEVLNVEESLSELSSLYVNKKHTRNSNKNQVRYNSFSYQPFDKYMTPFYSVNVDSVNDVFNQQNGIIIEGNVETDINAIVDNLGDLYSTIVGKSEVTNRRFIIQRYNLALEKLKPINLKGSKMIAQRVKIAENDPISINSILTLPEPTVRFSKINLPGSNLLVRANLNMHFLNYWQLLKQKTDITKITIDGLDNEIEYDDNNFVDDIKQYVLDLSEYNKPGDITNLDVYKIFLQTIIPKIKILFRLVKKYIKGKLSLVDVVSYLEPFLIYPIDLTYSQYNEINYFIVQKIKEYNVQFKEYSTAFSNLRFLRRGQREKDGQYYFSNPLFDIISDTDSVRNDILELYGFASVKNMSYSGSEFLKRITIDDYGQLYNTSVAFTNLELMFPSSITEVLNKDSNHIKQILDKRKSEDKCSTYIIAKKYYSMDGLNADNNKVIYYDKDYDTTNYDLINEKYKKERDELTGEELIVFLTEEFKKKNKMDETSAEYMATTLVNQAKKVREGDYALLLNTYDTHNPETLEYYVRRNDIWVLDKDVDPKNFIVDEDVLCNLDYSCIYDTAIKHEDKCESTAVAKDTMIQNALKQIIDQFDSKYEISKTELNTRINNELNYFKRIFERLQKIKDRQFYKYNKIQYDLGLSVTEDANRVVSPYAKLRDLIMGQNDFIKRQNDILQFVSFYCYEGNPSVPNINDGEMEDEWWLYCKQTNTKLLPKFHYILASTFVNNHAKYDDVLNDLKRQIGKRSDNGDAWVDEHSGEVICYIDMDVSEGYKDGFVDKSRDILERDVGEVMLEKQREKHDKRLSPEGEIVSNIVSILSSNMGIDIEQSREFIVRVVTEMMSDTKVIEKEPAYRKREEEAAKKGKKLPSYGTLYGSTILYLSLGMFLIGVQTSIPSIKTRKTAPGCVKSFEGFPFSGEGDDSALNYVACVALKSRDPSTIPWNVLPTKEEKIATTMKSFIVRYLLPYQEVQQKIKDKTEYLLVNPDEEIPEEYDLSKWLHFLPPLKRFNVRHLENISDGFSEELNNNLFSGSARQIEKILIIKSKIIAFSLAIQEAIQKLVEKKNLLLKSSSQFFMDNACCNEANSHMTSLQYFVNEDKRIEMYNNNVASLSALIRDIKTLTEASIMLSEINTKRMFPVLSNEFSEETIYHAFITLCKFQSSIPLSEELASVCIDKPDYLNKMDTIQEKISKLKRDGRNYTKEQFLRLFQIVSRNNIIKMSKSNDVTKCIDGLKKVLIELDEKDDDNVPKSLTQKMDLLVAKNDVIIKEDTKDMRAMKDYLQISIDKMRRELIDFIKLKSKATSLELKKLTKFITNISIWSFNNSNRNTDIKIYDDGLNNYVNFMKTYIELFVIVFPSMIIHQKMQSIIVPKYWGLASNHANDVKEMVSNFYNPIEKFYGDETIKNVLREIMSKSRGIYLLSKNTPIFNKIQIGDDEMYNSFDKRMIMLLYEYYFLSVMTDYISLTRDPSMVTRMLVNPDKEDNDIFAADFLVEQQMRFSESEQEFIEGDVMRLNQDVSKLLVSFLTIMMRSKKTIDVSYEDIQDKVFKLKEAEKYDFTDKLKELTDEGRAVDTILKHNKLGPIYSLGMSKGIKEYDPEHFEHDKEIAERVTQIQNRIKKNKNTNDVDDFDMDDAINNEDANRFIDMDNAMNMNQTDDYNDGDPWGDEVENNDDYY